MSDRPRSVPPDTAHKSHGRGILESPIERGGTADLPSHSESEIVDTRSSSPERGRPRWVAVVAIVIAALVFLGFVFLHLSGGLGPGLHGGG